MAAFGYGKDGIVFCADGLLRFADAASQSCVVLCDRPNCSHNAVWGEIDDQTCNAAIPADAWFPAIYHDKLYFVYSDRVNEYRVFESDKSGSNRRELARLDNVQAVCNGIYVKNYLICAYKNIYDLETEDFDAVELERPVSGVIIINLKNGKVIRVLEKQDYWAEVFKLHYDKNKIYYSYVYLDDKIDDDEYNPASPEAFNYIRQHMITSIWCYDIKTGEDSCVYSGRYYNISDFGGHYAYLIEGAYDTTQIYELNLLTGEKELLVGETNIAVCLADKDRLNYTIINGNETTYKYYDLKKKEAKLVGKRNSAISPTAVVEDKVYVTFYDKNGEYCEGYITKDDYYNGNFDRVVPLIYPNSYY